jgi:UBX domain-containing protein 1
MCKGDVNHAVDLFLSGGDGGRPSRPSPQPAAQGPRPAAPPPDQGPRRGVPPPDLRGVTDDIFNAGKDQPYDQAPAEGFTLEKHKVTFWKNGFQVDDGDFRPNDDPANAPFLASVQKGQIPREFYKPGVEIDLEVEDERESDYKAKPKPVNPFGGQSRSMGGAAPAKPPPPAAAPAAPVKTNFASGASTKIRFQMPDGSNLVLTVDLTATIGDLKNYLRMNRPDFACKVVKLEVPFPLKTLADEKETVEQAGLKMSQLKVSLI